MENFLRTNRNENSFLFLTLSNKHFKRCPAMSACKNSLDCFEYYTDIIEYLHGRYKVTGCIEKYHDKESYHLHILIDPTIDKDKDNPFGLADDMCHYAESHCEQYSTNEWKTSNDKYDNPTLTYGPSFKLKIVNTIDNITEVIKYINKEREEKEELKSHLLNLLITRFCKKKYTRKEFMNMRMYAKNDWIEFRDKWVKEKFRYCYVDIIQFDLDEMLYDKVEDDLH